MDFAAKLPSNDLNFALDLGVDFLLLLFTRPRPKDNPQKESPPKFIGIFARHFTLGFLQKPFLDLSGLFSSPASVGILASAAVQVRSRRDSRVWFENGNVSIFRVGFWQNGVFADFYFWATGFFADFLAGFFLLIFVGKGAQKNPPGKSPAKSSKIYTAKIPDTFLQRVEKERRHTFVRRQSPGGLLGDDKRLSQRFCRADLG